MRRERLAIFVLVGGLWTGTALGKGIEGRVTDGKRAAERAWTRVGRLWDAHGNLAAKLRGKSAGPAITELMKKAGDALAEDRQRAGTAHAKIGTGSIGNSALNTAALLVDRLGEKDARQYADALVGNARETLQKMSPEAAFRPSQEKVLEAVLINRRLVDKVIEQRRAGKTP
jgi:hypothetical protein